MLVDFNNPLSMKYSDYSLKSFECVSDVFEIERVQCYTPTTKPDHDWNLKKDHRRPAEQSLLLSIRELLQQIVDGERFIIMEHDAYLIPEREDIFRVLLEQAYNMALWCVGIATECWTIESKLAENMIKVINNDHKHKYKGPLEIMCNLEANCFPDMIDLLGSYDHGKKVAFLTDEKANYMGIGDRAIPILNRQKADYWLEAPVTQLMDIKCGSTVNFIGVKDQREAYPNMKYIDLDEEI